MLCCCLLLHAVAQLLLVSLPRHHVNLHAHGYARYRLAN
jgi:hypothetical protein